MNKFRRVDGGFTLIELLVVILIAGVLAGIAAPSLISQKKTMKSAVGQVEGMLKTVNLVARANSGNPYRISPFYDTVKNQYQFRVETRRNGTCASTDKWIGDNNKFVYLPPGIVIKHTDNTEFKDLTDKTKIDEMTTCFNGRGELRDTADVNTNRRFKLLDVQGESMVRRTEISISAVGDVSRQTFSSDTGGTALVGSPLS
jgi:prepilin-type N-terminal cleavage/methylation domain-containing protein